jgi:SAM-dependent methyltransferase
MQVSQCRLCGGQLSDPIIDLGSTPLANEFVTEPEPQDIFPLQICVCQVCQHYQLNVSVSPERLFRNYLFVAGTSSVNVEHFRQYAVKMVEDFQLGSASRVLDVASNDGTLLKEFAKLGLGILGIDPARNLAVEANRQGISTIPEFFTEALADQVLVERGQFDLITANNVFAHLPDLTDFTRGVKKLLAPGGVFVFEVSYFLDVCQKNLFDTVYHEHTSYHTVKPLISFFDKLGLQVFRVDRIPNHGGSIRVLVCRQEDYGPEYYDERDRVLRNVPGGPISWCPLHNQLAEEYYISREVQALQNNIKSLGYRLRERLQQLKNQSKSIAIYGMPAKATSLLYALQIDEKMIDFAIDDAPLKQNTFSPGKHIPVLATGEIYRRRPDVLLILAWNFAESIIQKHKDFKGTWIIPLSEYQEIGAQ